MKIFQIIQLSSTTTSAAFAVEFSGGARSIAVLQRSRIVILKMLAINVACLLLSGCGFMGIWLNGYPMGVPPRDLWDLSGGTVEERAKQWVACGGTENGGYSLPPGTVSDADERMKADSEKFYQMQICMSKYGYKFSGSP